MASCAAAAALAALVTACGGGEPFVTSGTAPSTLERAAAPWLRTYLRARDVVASRDRGGSWMRPEAKKKSLLYVSNGGAGSVLVYSYPAGKSSGKLKGLHDPAGVCADASGNVWIVESASKTIVEYAHGGTKPKAKLTDSGALNVLGCSVDPTSGDLAVTDLGNQSGGGGVWIYANAKGTPTQYTSSKIAYAYFAGYDAAGDLFVDGLDATSTFQLVELASGSSALRAISLDHTVAFPGGVQWDGTYLAVGDQTYHGKHQSAVDRFSIAGSSGTLHATIPLEDSCAVLQFAISGASMVAPDACQNDAKFYAYPGGGTPTKTLGGFAYPVGAAVSR